MPYPTIQYSLRIKQDKRLSPAASIRKEAMAFGEIPVKSNESMAETRAMVFSLDVPARSNTLLIHYKTETERWVVTSLKVPKSADVMEVIELLKKKGHQARARPAVATRLDIDFDEDKLEVVFVVCPIVDGKQGHALRLRMTCFPL